MYDLRDAICIEVEHDDVAPRIILYYIIYIILYIVSHREAEAEGGVGVEHLAAQGLAHLRTMVTHIIYKNM